MIIIPSGDYSCWLLSASAAGPFAPGSRTPARPRPNYRLDVLLEKRQLLFASFFFILH